MSVYASIDELRKDRARWKRKNKIAQLKRTIARLKFENEIFKHSFIQNRNFLKSLLSLVLKPKSTPIHRLCDIKMQLDIKLASMKDYEQKETKHD